MSKKQDDEMPTTFPSKWLKVLKELPEFKDTADAASADDLKKIIVTCEGNISNIEKDKEADVKLTSAKEIIKDMSGPYRDAIKCQTAKIKYSVFLLEGKGEDVGDKDED